jgi:hypothetical protein
MFTKLKTFFAGLSYAWKYGDIIRNTTIALSNFPGWDDSELLRIWVRPLMQPAFKKELPKVKSLWADSIK